MATDHGGNSGETGLYEQWGLDPKLLAPRINRRERRERKNEQEKAAETELRQKDVGRKISESNQSNRITKTRRRKTGRGIEQQGTEATKKRRRERRERKTNR